MIWNDQYQRYSKIWGDNPSELARMAMIHLQEKSGGTNNLNILDAACGYGRDTFYLYRKLGCRVTGVDISEKAIQMADSSLSSSHEGFLQFIKADFLELLSLEFDILFASNFYHLLDRPKRSRFLNTVREKLKPGGRLFLSTHSVRDPQLFGKGAPHTAEPNAFYYKKTYRHFSTAEDIQKDFNFLEILELFEHEYLEARQNREPHHHISWILMGRQVNKLELTLASGVDN